MRRALRSLSVLSVGFTLCLSASLAQAGGAWLGFRNELPVPVFIQGATLVDGVLRRDRPRLLYPGEVAWDSVNSTGDKILTIYIARQPIQVLYQDTVPSSTDDQFFSIQLEPPPSVAKGQKPVPAKIKLTAAKPPSPPPNRPTKSPTR